MKRLSFSLIAVIMFSLLLVPLPLHASNNGQQLVVYACGVEYIQITGLNQHGDENTYILWMDPHSCVTRKTYNWWWMDEVYLWSHDPAGIDRLTVAYVPAVQQNSDEFKVDLEPFSMTDVYMARAQLWVDEEVSYSMEGHYLDQIYRRDCSGYVGFVWQLPASPSTVYLGQYADEIGIEDLAPGDAINDQEAEKYGHVVIFAGWRDFKTLKFNAYEENGDKAVLNKTLWLEWTGDGYSVFPNYMHMDNVVFQRRAD